MQTFTFTFGRGPAGCRFVLRPGLRSGRFRLPQQSHTHHRAGGARRQRRHCCAHCSGGAGQKHGPAGDRGKPAECGLYRGHAIGRQGRSGRVHPAGAFEHLLYRADDFGQCRLRPGQGFCPHHAYLQGADVHGGPSERAGAHTLQVNLGELERHVVEDVKGRHHIRHHEHLACIR